MTFRRKLWFVLLAAAANALVGAGLGFYASRPPADKSWQIMPWYSGAAWLLASAGLWWLLVVHKGRPSAFRGAVAGGLSGILGYPLTNVLFWAWPIYQSLLIEAGRISVAENLYLWLVTIVGMSVFSFMVFGLISVLAGIALGLAVGWLQKRSRREADGISTASDNTSTS